MIKLWSGFKEKKIPKFVTFFVPTVICTAFRRIVSYMKKTHTMIFIIFFLSLSWYISHQEDIKSNGKKWMWSSERKTNNLKENERPILIFIFIIFHSDSFFLLFVLLAPSANLHTHTHKQTNSLQMDDSLFYRCEINIILSYTLDFFFFIFYYYYYYLSCRTFSSFMFRDSCNLQKKKTVEENVK